MKPLFAILILSIFGIGARAAEKALSPDGRFVIRRNANHAVLFPHRLSGRVFKKLRGLAQSLSSAQNAARPQRAS